jgi:hypothetical protein
MTCCVLKRGMMVGGAEKEEEIDKAALCAKTDTLTKAEAAREDEVGEAKLTLMPAVVGAEESIGEAIKIAAGVCSRVSTEGVEVGY